MPRISPVNPEAVAGRHWARPQNYAFAAAWGSIPLCLAEVYPIASSMPVGFIKTSDGFRPVVITGQQADHNLYIGPEGQWLGRLLPQALRTYPFQLVHTRNDNFTLCVDLDSPCIVPASDGLPFYKQETIAPPLKALLDALNQRESDIRGPLSRACQAINDAGVFELWPLDFKREDGSTVSHQGLYRINAGVLTSLRGETLEHLHQALALPLIYAHRLSTFHLHSLDRLAKAQGLGRKPVNLDSMFGEGNDTLSFNF